jgi:hypothetical protein
MITVIVLETLALPWVVLMQGETYKLENPQARALIEAGLVREVLAPENPDLIPKVSTKRNNKKKGSAQCYHD